MKKAIVFLPGMLCNEQVFSAQAEHFKNEEWQVYVPKITGHPAKLSGQVKQILQDLPDKFVLVGFSLGGSIALEMVKQEPNRVTHLILMDCTDVAFTNQQEAGLKQQIEQAKDIGIKGVVQEQILPTYFPNGNPYLSELTDLVLDMADSFSIEQWQDQANLLFGRKSYRDVLVGYEGKCLICAGEHDKRIPIDVIKDMAKARNQEIKYFDNCGHIPSIENPELVTEVLLDFCS